MQMIQSGYRGLSLVFDMNWDRLLYIATIAFSLSLGAFLGTLVQ